MTRIERAARDHPALYAFGTEPFRFLSAEEEKNAPFESRLRSCWCYLIGRVSRFAAAMSQREQANYDVEDLIQEIVIRLMEKDHKWDASRGRYSTFADRVARNILMSKREQARVVKGPSNALAKLKECQKDDREGRLTGRRRETMLLIAQVFSETEVCSPATTQPQRESPPLAPRREVVAALRLFSSPLQAFVLSCSSGLLGGVVLTSEEIASRMKVDRRKVKHIEGQAKRSMRDRIEKLRAKV